MNAVPTGGPPKAANQLPPHGTNSSWVQNWAATNGNSTTSSRTSSPALGNTQPTPMPPMSGASKPVSVSSEAARVYATNGPNNNNLPPMASSQSQPPPATVSQSLQSGPTTAAGLINVSPNNNWSSGKMTAAGINLVNTPPKSASGMSTPLNASTPTLTGPTVLSGQQQTMQKLTASVQDLTLQRPPALGNGAQAGGTVPLPQNQQQMSTPMTNGNSGQTGP
uniref:Uncharacterized protein n=1 Tax=Anopheles maculatus TaxID=74869 RepID=A0A182SHR6_9DIPT